MTERRRWVRRSADKIPLTGAGRYASSTKPNTWASFEDCVKSTAGVGLGYVLGDGIGCWDFDHCIIDGKLSGWVREAIKAIPNPLLVEVSQSGEGVHVFVEAPEGPGRVIRDGERCIEFYSSGRYIAVTGNPLKL
jgi:primase-polymerase (primpol)-like protein